MLSLPGMRYRPQRGMGLAGTLLVASLLMTLAFTTAAMTFSHFTLSNQVDKAAVARSLAEAAANRAIARCLADITYGTRKAVLDDITVTFPSAPEGWGKVYFGGSDAVLFGNIPLSHNFLAQDIPSAGTGRSLPSRSLHIIAIGQFARTRRAVETIVAIPQYKYAIASTGQIQASGGLLVAGVKNPAAVEAGVNLIPDDQWAPGCMMSNSADPQAAIDLDSGNVPSRITGDVRSAGGIKLGAATTVEGALKAFASPEEVPKVRAADFDTQGMTGCNSSLGPDEGNLKISGPARRQGNLSVTGGLRLDDGILFVDGDVTVRGGLHGKGALISTGKVEIFNQSSFKAADDQAAIVAQSDVALHGSDKDTCIYNGVVFTQGDFQANDLTLLGALCAAKTEGSQVQLDHVNLLSNPISLDLQYVIQGPLSDQIANWRRDQSISVASANLNVGGYVNGTQVDPAQTLPITPGGIAPQVFTNAQNQYSVVSGAELQVGVDKTNYDSGIFMTEIVSSQAYKTLITPYLPPASNGGSYHLAVGKSDSFTYNTDYTKGWDPQANGGQGGFTMEKFAQAYPLGVFDGNASIELTNLAFHDSVYGTGAHWYVDENFNGRTLYEAIRSLEDPQPKTFRLVNKDYPSQVRQVTLADIFDPGGDAASHRAWARSAASNLWAGMTSDHFSIYEDPFHGALPSPLPREPWNSLTTMKDPNWYAYGSNFIGKWLASQTNFHKPQYQGSFNFNPLQFVQLRDQNQRLLWREYEP